MTGGEREQPGEVTTVRRMVEALLGVADRLPLGLDAAVEFGVCDGAALQILKDVDVTAYSVFPRDQSRPVSAPTVLIRAHDHPGPGTSRGPLMRGAAADADDELQDLTSRDLPPGPPGPDDDHGDNRLKLMAITIRRYYDDRPPAGPGMAGAGQGQGAISGYFRS